jgi:acyl-CoA thioester hydrolase
VPTGFVHHLRVRYAECDMQGHVFNGNYLTWFDTAHTELLREAWGPYDRIVETGVEFVVAEANVRYLAPARFDDDLGVHVTLEPPGNSSLISRFEVRRGDDVLTEGMLRHVCVDAKTFAKAPWPDELRSAFEAYVA